MYGSNRAPSACPVYSCQVDPVLLRCVSRPKNILFQNLIPGTVEVLSGLLISIDSLYINSIVFAKGINLGYAAIQVLIDSACTMISVIAHEYDSPLYGSFENVWIMM